MILSFIIPFGTAFIAFLAIRRKPVVNRLARATRSEGLKLLGTNSIFHSRRMVRCSAGLQVLTYYYGPVGGIESIECAVKADPMSHLLPDFVILSNHRPEMLVNVIGQVSADSRVDSMENDFDICRDFDVYTSSVEEFRTILSPDMNVKLRQLKGLFRNNSLIVFCYGNSMRVIKASSHKNTVTNLSEFVSLSARFVSALFECVGNPLRLAPVRTNRMLPASAAARRTNNALDANGMAFLPEPTPVAGRDFKLLDSNDPAEEESKCQICGALIDETFVTCMKCDTPYHKDCWEYNGQCAIFGCMCQDYMERQE